MERDEVISKIQKLLRLAESSNVHEAASAAAKAQELMDRFEIEAASLSTASAPANNEPVETVDFDSSGRLENWRGSLLATLCSTNGCKAYKTRLYDGGGKETVLRVIGRKTDSQTVRYMYQALVQVVEGLAMGQRGNGRQFIASFKSGAAAAICERIRASKEATKRAVYAEAAQEGGMALMRVDNAVATLKARDAALERYMEEQNLRLRKGSGGRVTDHSGYHSGYRAGQAANIGGGHAQLGAGRAALPR